MHKRSLSRRLVGGTLWALLARVLGVASAIVATAMLARFLSLGDMGVYFLAVSLVTVVAGVGQMGLERAAVRRVSAALAVSQSGEAERVGIVIARLGAVAALVSAAVLYLAVLPILAAVFPKIAPLLPLRSHLALWVLASVILAIASHIMRGFHDVRRASFLDGALAPALLAAAYAVLVAIGADSSLQVVMLIAALATSLAAVVALMHLQRRLQGAAPVVRYKPRQVLADAAPFWVRTVMLLVLSQSDIWVLGLYQPEEEVATYGALKRLVLLVVAPMVLISSVVQPTVSELYEKREMAELGKVLRATGLVTAAPSIVVLLALIIAPEFWLRLVYGDPYAGGATALVIASVGFLLAVPFGVGSLALTMTDDQRALMTITVVTGMLSLGGMLYAGKGFGAVGVAAVIGVTLVVQRALFWWVLRRRYDIRTDLASLRRGEIRAMLGSVYRMVRDRRER